MAVATVESLVTEVNQEIEVKAAPGDVYRGLIARLSKLNTGQGSEPMPMVLEEWPGGRWFRDLGSGTGHLWGFVRSIKPPTLIELYGPMFMSFAVASNMIIRIEAVSGGAKVTLRHEILGPIPEDYRGGISAGWQKMMDDVKRIAENQF